MTATFAITAPPHLTPAPIQAPDDRQELDLFRRAAAAARVGMWACDLDTDQLWWSDGVYDLFGLPRGSAIDRSRALALYDPDSRHELSWHRNRAVRDRRPFSLDARLHLTDGRTRWMRIIAAVDDGAGHRRLFGTKQDVTEERMLAERLRRLADSDPLTGLANRGVFETWLTGGVVHPVGALALIDIDRFKSINDRHGHAAGDDCLRHVASQLRAGFADAPLLARIGGDEFALGFPGKCTPRSCAVRLSDLIALLSKGAGITPGVRGVGISIGVALVDPHAAVDPRALFAAADSALYAAKAGGRSTLRFADPQSGQAARSA